MRCSASDGSTLKWAHLSVGRSTRAARGGRSDDGQGAFPKAERCARPRDLGRHLEPDQALGRKALPNSSGHWRWIRIWPPLTGDIGLAKIFAGRAEETEAHVNEALRLSPHDSFAWLWLHFAGGAKLQLGADEEAVAKFRRSIEINRNFPLSHFFLAAALANLGKLDEAQSETKPASRSTRASDPAFSHRGSGDNPSPPRVPAQGRSAGRVSATSMAGPLRSLLPLRDEARGRSQHFARGPHARPRRRSFASRPGAQARAARRRSPAPRQRRLAAPRPCRRVSRAPPRRLRRREGRRRSGKPRRLRGRKAGAPREPARARAASSAPASTLKLSSAPVFIA